MDLYYEMLLHRAEQLMEQRDVRQYQLETDRWVEMECFHALAKIKCILEDDSLRDEECFYQIEEIINIFEDLGSECGNRHDFG